MLETSILPPARRQESIFVPACVLLAVNPVIFVSCWGAFWEPFLFLCILERTCFFIGLFCVFWTLAVSELAEQGLKCGRALWSLPVRRTGYAIIRTSPSTILMVAFTVTLMLESRLSQRPADHSDRDSASGRPRREVRCRKALRPTEKERAEERQRWLELQEPWRLKRRDRPARRRAAKLRRENEYARVRAYAGLCVRLAGDEAPTIRTEREEKRSARLARRAAAKRMRLNERLRRSLYVACWIRSTFDAFDEACTLHTGVDAPEVVSVPLNKFALQEGKLDFVEYTDPTWYVNSLVYEYCQVQMDEASTQVATTLYEMMSVREVAVAVPAGSQFPLTDYESRPIDFGACELTPMEQIMVAELQADAARYVSIDTNGNGACGLHAPFGVLVTAACCERSPEIQTFNVTKFVSMHKCTPRDLGRTGSACGIAGSPRR